MYITFSMMLKYFNHSEIQMEGAIYVVVSPLPMEVFKAEISHKGIPVLGGRLYKLNFMSPSYSRILK